MRNAAALPSLPADRVARRRGRVLPALSVLLTACATTPQHHDDAAVLSPQATTTSYLSDLSWTRAVSGYGPVERDRANGDVAANDGGPLIIEGVRYNKGLGVHSNSEVVYALSGACSTLNAVVGLNDYKLGDALGSSGSVVFQVYADGTKLYDSGVMRGNTPAKNLSLNLSGKKELRLVTTDAGDGRVNDHADWADATLTCGAGTTNSLVYRPMAKQAYFVTEQQGEMVGGQLYVFGGFDAKKSCCTPTQRAYRYDPASNTWTPRTAMPGTGTTHSGMTSDAQSIYYAGGYIGDANWTQQVFGTREVWRYTVATDRYTRLPDLPVERAAGQLELLNGKLHYFGGTNRARTQDTAEHFVLDLQNGATSWTQAAPLPNARNHLGSAVLGGKLYAIGGQHSHDERAVTQAAVHVYDEGTNSWTARASLPKARSHIENSTFVLGGRIVVAGGESSPGQQLSDVNAYDPNTNSWSALTPLPIARIGGVGAPLATGFVFTGGNTKNGDSTTSWIASPQP